MVDPVDVAHGVAARRLWKHSQIAALAARLIGGRSASFTCGGWVNLSKILAAAAATPQAMVAAKSGVDMVLWVAGCAPVRRSGPLGATLRPPISMAVSVSVCVLRGEPRV